MKKPTSLVYNMDCMEYMAGCKDKVFDLVIADPPYGIGRDWLKRTRNVRKVEYSDIKYSNERMCKEFFEELKRVSKRYVIFGYNYYVEYLGSTNYLIVWDKKSANNKAFHYSKCEIACTNIRIPCNIVHIEWDGYRMGSQRGEKKIHPHEKPVNLYRWILENYANKGDIVFDPCVGSGSSRIAAFDMGFDFHGCEIDKAIYNRQERRFNNHIIQQVIDF